MDDSSGQQSAAPNTAGVRQYTRRRARCTIAVGDGPTPPPNLSPVFPTGGGVVPRKPATRDGGRELRPGPPVRGWREARRPLGSHGEGAADDLGNEPHAQWRSCRWCGHRRCVSCRLHGRRLAPPRCIPDQVAFPGGVVGGRGGHSVALGRSGRVGNRDLGAWWPRDQTVAGSAPQPSGETHRSAAEATASVAVTSGRMLRMPPGRGSASDSRGGDRGRKSDGQRRRSTWAVFGAGAT
jgi:hypothetical protein